MNATLSWFLPENPATNLTRNLSLRCWLQKMAKNRHKSSSYEKRRWWRKATFLKFNPYPTNLVTLLKPFLNWPSFTIHLAKCVLFDAKPDPHGMSPRVVNQLIRRQLNPCRPCHRTKAILEGVKFPLGWRFESHGRQFLRVVKMRMVVNFLFTYFFYAHCSAWTRIL